MYFNTLSASFFVKEDGSCLCKVGPNFSRRTTHQLCLQKKQQVGNRGYLTCCCGSTRTRTWI